MLLRTKLSIFASIIVIFVVLLVSIFIFIAQRRLLLRDLYEERNREIQSLVAITKESITSKDDLLLLNYIGLLKRTSRMFAKCAVLDKNNIVIAPADSKFLRHKVEDLNLILGDETGVLRFTSPVILANETIATAIVDYSQDRINKIIREALSKITNRILLAGGIALLIGIAVAFIFAHTMTKPIMKLAEGTKLIGSGNLETKIYINTGDELEYLAKEFNKMTEKLKELDEMKSDFVSSVTHELRSPLATIESYVNLMLDSEDELIKGGRVNLIRIKDNTARLGKFIDDLLDVAKIERAEMFIRKEKMYIYPLVQEVSALFYLPAKDKNIKLKTVIADGLPVIYADPDRIRQVLINLLSNALKFTPPGGLVTIEAKLQDRNSVLFTVSDTGVGIPASKLEKIFGKFYQVKETLPQIQTQSGILKGTGLGLSVAKGIVELHSGKIWAESELGKGSKFYFLLPVGAKT
ncbi:MAG: HAMP domain-containing sensor histidine kinase [Elusimicrobiota bacterium]|nr:HAMP domain-containing sensor histidine kinase [Elusimicrobiota bacterium]